MTPSTLPCPAAQNPWLTFPNAPTPTFHAVVPAGKFRIIRYGVIELDNLTPECHHTAHLEMWVPGTGWRPVDHKVFGRGTTFPGFDGPDPAANRDAAYAAAADDLKLLFARVHAREVPPDPVRLAVTCAAELLAALRTSSAMVLAAICPPMHVSRVEEVFRAIDAGAAALDLPAPTAPTRNG